MKFEQLLQIYWSRGFLYGGRVLSFNLTLNEFFLNLKGFNKKSQRLFVKRFELNNYIFKKDESLVLLPLDQRKIINMYLSQVININNSVAELHRYNVLRLYLIKSFRGRAQALGKPSRGQRTWSNAWTAHNYNKILKTFIGDVKKNSNVKKVVESKNKKIIKKKYKKSSNIFKIKKIKKKDNIWF